MRLLLAFVLGTMTCLQPAFSQDNNESQDVIAQEQAGGAFKGLFYKVWSKFKSMSPRQELKIAKSSNVTAGIRGAETTTSLLEPYWKGDRTSDSEFMQQLDAFAQAERLADKGELEQAARAFAKFTQQWPESDLGPNAHFAHAIVVAARGESSDGRKLLDAFIKQYPEHPLVADARLLIAEMP